LQYYNFLRLGRSGYEQIVARVLENAGALARGIAELEELELLNDGSRFPLVALRASEASRARSGDEGIDLTRLSHLLRERGWIVPVYALPANAEHISVLRMVVKENFSRDMVDLLTHECARRRTRWPRARASTRVARASEPCAERHGEAPPPDTHRSP
jgi:glutamate decarboxylase